MAFKEAMKKASPALLEPIMAVEAVVPDDYLGDVMGNLNSRRGISKAQSCGTGHRSSGRRRR